MGLMLTGRQRILVTLVLSIAFATPFYLSTCNFKSQPEQIQGLKVELKDYQRKRIEKKILEATKNMDVDIDNWVKETVNSISISKNLTSDSVFFILEIIKDSKTQTANALNLINKILNKKNLDIFEETYEKGRTLVKSLGLDETDSVTVLNFTHGLISIGEENLKKLYDKFGIEYFGRYTEETLNELLRNLDGEYRKDKPVALAILNKNDWNGAFYDEGSKLEELIHIYKLIISEVKTDEAYKNEIKNVAEGYGLLSLLLVGGHGTVESIQLGNVDGDGEKARIDIEDIKGGKISGIECYLVENAVVILDACSTGDGDESLGKEYSNSTGLKTFAPTKPGNIESYVLSKNGRVIGVSYTEKSSEFGSDGAFAIDQCMSKVKE